MTELTLGAVVKSLKGHDTGRLYIVCTPEDEGFVLLTDGEYRKKDNPKKKRVKHLKTIAPYCGEDIQKMTDAAVRRNLKKWSLDS